MTLTRTLLFTAMVMLCAGTAMSQENQPLSPADRAIVSVAAHTANGDLASLRQDLVQGLDAGLTVNELKEVLVQLYAYTGFPRSLNAIHAFMQLEDERAKAGITDTLGREASPIPSDINKDAYGARMRADLAGRKEIPPAAGYQVFAPAIDTFLKEHLFCDIFARDVLEPRQRELATIGALAAMDGTAGQLVFHLNAAMNTGTTEAQMQDYLDVIRSRVSPKNADAAATVLDRVLKTRAERANQ